MTITSFINFLFELSFFECLSNVILIIPFEWPVHNDLIPVWMKWAIWMVRQANTELIKSLNMIVVGIFIKKIYYRRYEKN